MVKEINEEFAEKLYELVLGEHIVSPYDENVRYVRVPGGWIYEVCKYDPNKFEETPITLSTTFIAINNEFRVGNATSVSLL